LNELRFIIATGDLVMLCTLNWLWKKRTICNKTC
jgi:hypothetical protein